MKQEINKILKMNKAELLKLKWSSDCSDCFKCSDCSYCLKQKEKTYMIANVQFTKEEYEKWKLKTK